MDCFEQCQIKKILFKSVALNIVQALYWQPNETNDLKQKIREFEKELMSLIHRHKYFSLCERNLQNIWVAFSEMFIIIFSF